MTLMPATAMPPAVRAAALLQRFEQRLAMDIVPVKTFMVIAVMLSSKAMTEYGLIPPVMVGVPHTGALRTTEQAAHFMRVQKVEHILAGKEGIRRTGQGMGIHDRAHHVAVR